jgi:hypothetical protein
MSDSILERAANQIVGRMRRNPILELDDIVRFGKNRESTRRWKGVKPIPKDADEDSDEDEEGSSAFRDKLQRLRYDANEYEEELVNCIVNPGRKPNYVCFEAKKLN